MALYIYDIECLPNLFSAIFLKAGQTKLINEYIEADIKGETLTKSKILHKLEHKLFVIFYGNETYQINDYPKIVKFLTRNNRADNLTLAGYNSVGYDDLMIDYLYSQQRTFSKTTTKEVTEALKIMNDNIINDQQIYFETRKSFNIPNNNNYQSIDLQSLNNLHKLQNRVSLKQASVSLKWYKLEEYVMPDYTPKQFKELYGGEDITIEEANNLKSFDRRVHVDELNALLAYNWNDVFITDKLLTESVDELQSRIALKQKYNLNVLSSPRSGTAEKVMRLLYSQYTGLNYLDFTSQRTWRKIIHFKDIIHSDVKFNTPELKALYDKLWNTSFEVYGDKRFKEIVSFKETDYIMGLGGLHSKDRGGYYKATDKLTIQDADVDSYYPRSMIIHKIKPAHLSVVIIDIINNLVEQRLRYKRLKDKINAYIYKIIVNSIFGEQLAEVKEG